MNTPSSASKPGSAATTEATLSQYSHGPLNIIKYRWLFLGLSALFLIPGVVFMVLLAMRSPIHAPLLLGIDFTGGTILEMGFEKSLSQNDLPTIRTLFEEKGYTGSVVQLKEAVKGLAEASSSSSSSSQVQTTTQTITAKPTDTQSSSSQSAETSSAQLSVQPQQQQQTAQSVASVLSIRTKPLTGEQTQAVTQMLQARFGPSVLLQKNLVGPTLASELFVNGLLALLLAYILIVAYLTVRFQWDYAVCAIVALLHDGLFVLGVFATLGYLFHTEVDSLFITALLTVAGFSVHDTIVVFDRLRENTRLFYSKKLPFSQIANISVNQTLGRSINTSVTALLTLTALYFFGGQTTRDFVLVMILGIIVGTYSSIFVASLLLVMWRERQQGALATGNNSQTSSQPVLQG